MKIALLNICTNLLYWQYAKPFYESARRYFLLNHSVDYFLWTDIPEATEPNGTNYGATAFYAESVDHWAATMMRYHLFLQIEEKLREYDYVFFSDIDMKFVATVGDEILGQGLTATEHPMYSIRKEFQYPFELNPESSAYVKIPHHYFAGGFQGGKSADFIKAMHSMRRGINRDFDVNYRARWNDESHWNRYLFENPPAVILSPSYCYPASLVKEYYEPIWGQSYEPKLVTVDKTWAFTKLGDDTKKKLEDLSKIK